MNLKTPGSLSWVAYLEMGARLENSPPQKKALSELMGLFIFGNYMELYTCWQ